MSLWLIRCGRHGEHETDFLENNRVLLTWRKLDDHIANDLPDRSTIRARLAELYPNATPAKLSNNTGQINAFANRMQPGDWVVVPTKRRTLHVGEIKSGYRHHPDGPDPLYHSRDIDWLETDIPRTAFDQDILNSLGAIMTICQIKKNDAEARVRAMARNGWTSAGITLDPAAAHAATGTPTASADDDASDETDPAPLDLEQLARDQILRTLYAQYKGYGMEDLVQAILEAQGFTVHSPDKGPDGGVDLLAAPGTLGFGTPRICVQVKSQASPLDRPALDQLVGTMSNVRADQGLLVCWGGFKKTVKAELPRLFFKVRLWDQNDLLDQFLAHYDRFDDDLKAAVPLKRVWAVASGDESGDT